MGRKREHQWTGSDDWLPLSLLDCMHDCLDLRPARHWVGDAPCWPKLDTDVPRRNRVMQLSWEQRSAYASMPVARACASVPRTIPCM